MAERVPFWEDAPKIWRTLQIGADPLFTFENTDVDFRGPASKLKWDVGEANGTDGAREAYRGYVPMRGEIVWQVYTRLHWETYQDLLDQVEIREGKTAPKNIQVVHPLFALHRKRVFVYEEIPMERRNERGIMEISWKVLQYFKQPKVSPKPGTNSPLGTTETVNKDGNFTGNVSEKKPANLEVTPPSKAALKP